MRGKECVKERGQGKGWGKERERGGGGRRKGVWPLVSNSLDIPPAEVDDLSGGSSHVHRVPYSEGVQVLTHLSPLREFGVDITSIHLERKNIWSEQMNYGEGPLNKGHIVSCSEGCTHLRGQFRTN